MIQLIITVFIILFLFDKLFNNQLYHKPNYDGFISSQHIAPFNSDNYELSSPDTEYYYDRSGLKGNLFKTFPINNEIKHKTYEKKIDNFNSIINKLELYNYEIYN